VRLSDWSRGAAVVSLLLAARATGAADDSGSLFGFVEDTHGAPLSNAVISVFGRGLARGGVTTLSDSSGRFFLPALPAGSYTLRALREGHVPAAARQITVIPRRDSSFTVSLAPMIDSAVAQAQESVKPEVGTVVGSEPDAAEAARELRWLIRHKRRSVLDSDTTPYATEAHDRAPAPGGSLADLGATVELMTNPAARMSLAPFGIEGRPASLSSVRLNGKLTENGRWSLGGLIAESEGTAWRMAAEFVFEPDTDHRLQFGTGYSAGFVRTVDTPRERPGGRSLGAAFAQDRWQMSERVSATLGARFSYIGFLADSNHADPMFALDFQADPHTRVTGRLSRRTVVPGGDLLTLSTLAAPAIAFAVMDAGLRAEAVDRLEVGIEENRGPLTLRAETFFEAVRDQLANVYDGEPALRRLRIANVGGAGTRGMVLTVGRRFGEALSGSLSYTIGHASRPDPVSEARRVLGPALAAADADYTDVAARVEAFIDESDTRLVAFYRINALSPSAETGIGPLTSARFDVQLSQGLPFLGHLTRADWDLLLAVRNLHYETTEGAMVDELAVLNPPKRLLGGISVRF
jgi:TonB-dependent receptor-like protein/carboxypeptidase family protein